MKAPRSIASIDTLFTPADFSALEARDLSRTACVVFDVLRATSSIITALSNGARAVIPVADIPDALAIRRTQPTVLLAGERNGLRIPANMTGGIPFDLGNSPREFTSQAVAGRTIVTTTTNGTRALGACAHSRLVLVSAFLNLRATARHLQKLAPAEVLLVCGGTFEEAAYEDALCAGALCKMLVATRSRKVRLTDSALMAWRLFETEEDDLLAGLARARNGQKLLANPQLRDDVELCSRCDETDLVARLDAKGRVTALPRSRR
jgi:2-phosphosulfolactate phosphatase